MNKIAIFGGTFDPPHHGHIHMMHLLRETYHFDKVYLVPASRNPFKQTKTPIHHRLQMCKEAFGAFDWCNIIDVEASRGGISYTIDTVEYLLERDPSFREAERFLLLGEEAGMGLSEWKEVDRLLTLVQPLVISRDSFGEKSGTTIPQNILQSIKKGWTRASPLYVSSTEVRERVRKGLYIQHLVPLPVASYINKHHLYREG